MSLSAKMIHRSFVTPVEATFSRQRLILLLLCKMRIAIILKLILKTSVNRGFQVCYAAHVKHVWQGGCPVKGIDINSLIAK